MVARNDVLELSRKIAEAYAPEKIILFGSHAYGTPREDSDVDLLVIMPFEGHGFDKATEMLRRFGSRYAIDLIIRRPDDTERRFREGDPLIREALNKGRVLYGRHLTPKRSATAATGEAQFAAGERSGTRGLDDLNSPRPGGGVGIFRSVEVSAIKH